MVFIVNFAPLPFFSTIFFRLPRLERKNWTVDDIKSRLVATILEDIGKESNPIWLTFLDKTIEVSQGQPRDSELETLVIRQGLITIVQR